MLLAQSNNFLLNSYKLVPSIVGFMKIIVMGLRFCCGNVCGKYIYVQVIKQPPALTVSEVANKCQANTGLTSVTRLP